MLNNDHLIGFEKEDKLNNIFYKINEILIGLQWKEFIKIVDVLSPEILSGAFERRVCERKLKYIGDDDIHFFKCGEVYNSIDFNGATYSIEGYRRKIGSVYFECVDECF